MPLLAKTFVSPPISPHLPSRRNGRQFRPIIGAKKPNLGDKPQIDEPIFAIRVPNSFLARSVVAVFALGFIDAGYSGDWSRISVISTQTEELLKTAAYLIVPFCILLIVFISSEERSPE